MRAGICVMFLLAACDDCPPAPASYCAETHLTFDEGVYGRVFEQDDVARDCPGYLHGWGGKPATLKTTDVSATVVAEDVTDEDGLFELPAAAGSYMICVGNGCQPVTVAAMTRIRVDAYLPLGPTYVSGTPPPCTR